MTDPAPAPDPAAEHTGAARRSAGAPAPHGPAPAGPAADVCAGAFGRTPQPRPVRPPEPHVYGASHAGPRRRQAPATGGDASPYVGGEADGGPEPCLDEGPYARRGTAQPPLPGDPADVWSHPGEPEPSRARGLLTYADDPEPPDIWAPVYEPIPYGPPTPYEPIMYGPVPHSPVPHEPPRPRAPGGRRAHAARRPTSRMAHAAAATAGLSIAGSVLGLVRDQSIAHLFGAGAESDAFLVAWTVPEVAATVLIEDAMALLMVPAFSAALARGEHPRALLRGTLPRLLAALAVLTAALAACAPWVVGVLAPGLADPSTAVACTRLTALTVLTFGTAGYLSAALRAHRRFAAPAAIYVAYNVGIVAVLLALHGRFGVRAAAAGVAVGGALMVVVQLPSFFRVLRAHRKSAPDPAPGAAPGAARGGGNPLGLLLLAPVVVYTLGRQAQVLVERFFAAPLPAGAISHLNYAEKVAQLPMALSVMIVTVTFPVLSRALADGDREQARRRVERDLALACLVVLLGTAYVIACAPQIIHVLFQRGEFTAVDTADTAAIMRVYALGLLGQSLVGALVRPYFSSAGPTWYPAAVMGLGLLVTAVADALAVGPWGAYGIAAGNALGITLTAALLLRGLGRQSVAVRARAVAPRIARIALAALAATAAGWALAHRLPDPLTAVAACAVAVPAVFAGAALAVRVPEVPYLLATVTRKGRP